MFRVRQISTSGLANIIAFPCLVGLWLIAAAMPASAYRPFDGTDAAVAEKGKMVPRRISGVCAPHQRRLTDAILKARNIALLPFAASV